MPAISGSLPSRPDALYPRVSTIDQDCASQEADLRAWADAQGQPCRWFAEKFTGGSMSRPKFDQMMVEARAGRIGRIVVWRLDRLGRTAAGLTTLFDELQRLGVGLVSIRDAFDLGTPSGRLQAGILAVVAQFEHEIIKERVVAGIAAARAKGRRWGGSEKGSRSKRVTERVQAVRDLLASGHNVSEIARAVGLCRRTVYRLLKEVESDQGA